MQDVDGDASVFRIGIEAVDAGEIDEGEVGAADAVEAADALLDGDAGVVGDFLAEAGEAIEEGGFAGVRRTDEGDRVDAAREPWATGEVNRLWGAAAAHFASYSRTRIALAVSRRRATSKPSMEYTVGSPAGARRTTVMRASGTKPICIR